MISVSELDILTEKAKEDILGCFWFLLILIAAAIGFYWIVKWENHQFQQKDIASLSKFLAAGPIVKVIDTDYARHGTKEANYVTSRIVTCETKDGLRFNISQNVAPDLIPMIGELWEITMKIDSNRAWLSLVRQVPRE